MMRERFVERLEMLREQEGRLGEHLRKLGAEVEYARSQLDATMGARQECEYWIGEMEVGRGGSRTARTRGNEEGAGEAEALGELADVMLAEAAERLSPEVTAGTKSEAAGQGITMAEDTWVGIGSVKAAATPTWTGLHTFNAGAAMDLTLAERWPEDDED